MDIKQLSTYLLKPYEFNNRTHPQAQIERIATSIKEFGFNQAIVIDENNEVLVGHGRLLAAKHLKLDTVPVTIKAGLTEVQKKAYRILDNKLQNDSTWEFNNLELEIGFLEDNGFDVGAWGLDDLIISPSVDEPESDTDAEDEDSRVCCPKCNHWFEPAE